jgi:ribosomal protein L20A (L18A)
MKHRKPIEIVPNVEILCSYGCDKIAKFINVRGTTYICSPSFRGCPKYKKDKEMRCLEKTGYKNTISNPVVRKKIQDTMITKYGSTTPFGNKEILQKTRDTVKDKYGVDNVFELSSVKDKIKRSNIEIFGVENVSQNNDIKKKKVETCLKNYGVENPNQSPVVMERTVKTNIKRYGYRHPLQNPEIAERVMESGLQPKRYMMPSGEIFWIRGVEPMIVDDLLKRGYKESDIILKGKQKPTIKYINPEINKESFYFPDIYIVSENKIIEGKSKYTYELELEKNLAKQKACIEQGYNFEFIIL